MAISVQDLDQLLGYDPNTHSVTGIPSMKSAQPGQPVIPARSTMAPVQRNDMALDLATSGHMAAQPMIPKAAPPTATPTAPEIPSASPAAVESASIPALARPTPKQSVAAGMAESGTTAKQEGKNQFEQMMPQITAAPGTAEYGQQRQAQLDYKNAHPLGGDISDKPGFWGKLEHGLAKAGNIAGDIFAPGVMANIPGTDMNKRVQAEANAKWTQLGSEADLKKQQIEASKASEAATEQGNEPTPWTPQGSTTPIMVPFKSIPTLEAADTRANAVEQAAATKNAPALAKLGYKLDDDGKMVPIPDAELSPAQKQSRDLTDSVMALNEAKTAVEKAKNDPNSPAFKLAQERLNQAAANAQRMTEAMGLHEAEFKNKVQEQGLVKPSGQTTSRGDAAGAALELLPELQSAIRNNAASLGPIMGRIQKGEIKLGNVDPEIQKLYSTMQSFYALQPAIHGFRNAEFVKDFDSFVGNLSTNPEAVIAGLEGLKPTLEAVEKSGRTYKPRIVEGGAGGGAAATAGTKPPGW